MTPPALRPIGVIYRKEMLDLLRDKRTVFGMILMPILIYPLLMVGFSQLLVHQIGRIERQEFLVAVAGWEELPEVTTYFESGEARWRVRREGRDAAAALRGELAGDSIHLLVEVQPGAGAQARAGKAVSLRVVYNGANEESLTAWRHFQRVAEDARRGLVERQLRLRSVDPSILDPLRIVQEDQATPSQRGAFHLGRLVCVMLVLMAATGAFYPAVDMASGEKERGTMQTLLVSPARRSEIVAGKYLAVLTVCLVTTGLNLGSLGLTFSHLFLPGELARNASLTFAPTAGSLAAMMLVMLPLAGLFCAACLGLSAYASTYKEAMLYLSPFLLVATVGAMAPIIPGLRPSAGLQLVPVANAAVLLHQVVQGTAGLGAVALNVAVNAAYALLALRWAAWIFEREDVLLRGAAEIDWRLRRRPAARRSHPSVVEGVVYVLLSFAAAVALGHVLLGAPFLSILAVSQLGGFLLPLLVMLAAGGIDARRALRLRFPGWTNLAVGGLTAAAALVLSQVSFECLVGLYRRMGLDPLRSMQELLRPFQDALGPHRSAVELAFAGLLFAGLAPLCEELAFRGFLLSALRPAVGSAASVAVTGVLFGALHGMPPRCFVLAGLGMLFGAMVVRSGSLWVGVAAHAVNNGLVVLLAASGGAAPGPLDNLLAGLRAADPRTVALVALAAVVAPLGLLLLRPPPGPAPGDPPPLPSGPAIYSANKY